MIYLRTRYIVFPLWWLAFSMFYLYLIKRVPLRAVLAAALLANVLDWTGAIRLSTAVRNWFSRTFDDRPP